MIVIYIWHTSSLVLLCAAILQKWFPLQMKLWFHRKYCRRHLFMIMFHIKSFAKYFFKPEVLFTMTVSPVHCFHSVSLSQLITIANSCSQTLLIWWIISPSCFSTIDPSVFLHIRIMSSDIPVKNQKDSYVHALSEA